jgi:Tol biopolymer transport system component
MVGRSSLHVLIRRLGALCVLWGVTGCIEGKTRPPDGAGPAACDWRRGFTLEAPEPLVELNGAEEDYEPFMTPDGLAIYFASFRDGTSHQYVASRDRREARFSSVRRVFPDVAEGESALSIAPDGTVFLAAGWPGGAGQSDIWIARSPSAPLRSSDFVPLAAVNTQHVEIDPFPSADGQRLYLGRRDSPSSTHVYISRRGTDASFGPAELLLGVGNLPGEQTNPVVTADEQLIVFSSLRTGSTSHDVWYALWDQQAGQFTGARVAPRINHPTSDDRHIYLSSDGCEIIFASNRPGGAGKLDLYRSRYSPID